MDKYFVFYITSLHRRQNYLHKEQLEVAKKLNSVREHCDHKLPNGRSAVRHGGCRICNLSKRTIDWWASQNKKK